MQTQQMTAVFILNVPGVACGGEELNGACLNQLDAPQVVQMYDAFDALCGVNDDE